MTERQLWLMLVTVALLGDCILIMLYLLGKAIATRHGWV